MDINRPRLDAQGMAHLRAVVDGKLDKLRDDLAEAQNETNAYLVPYLVKDALEIVRIWSVLRPFSRDFLEPLEIAAEASVVMFLANDPANAPPLTLMGKAVRYSVPADESMVYVGRWIDAFFLNLLMKDKVGLDRLSQVPLREIHSSTQEPEYSILFAEALQGYWLRDRQTPKKLQKALDATDPEKFELWNQEYTLSISVNLMSVLWQTFDNDPQGLQNALASALEDHRNYWGIEKREGDWDGFISLGLSAMATMNLARGMPFDVQSDYLLLDPTSVE